MKKCTHKQTCASDYTRSYSCLSNCCGVRIAVSREAQQVAMEQELLESLPLLYRNRPEQVTMTLECKGRGGQPCQGAANISVTVRPLTSLHVYLNRSERRCRESRCVSAQCECVQRQEAVQTQITSLRRDIKKLQTDSMAPPPPSLAQAAVHTENFITSVRERTR